MKNKSDTRFFIDTNIFVYTFDNSAPKKKQRALEIVEQALVSGNGVISHQVIQEFVSVATTKFKQKFDYPRLVSYLDEILFVLWRAYPDCESYLKAVEISQNAKISWWDSLIVSAAISTSCKFILSEDLQNNATIAGVKIINPFA